MEWRSFADVRCEDSEKKERDERIQVHAKLEVREFEACEDSEEAVEAGYFVEEHGEGDHFCAGAEAHEVEEALGMSAWWHAAGNAETYSWTW